MKNFLKLKYNTVFYSLIAFLVLFIVVGIITENIIVSSIPLILGFTFFIIKDLKWLFYLFFLVLPFTIEYHLPNGTGIDLPGEMVLILLTVITFIFIAGKYATLNISILNNNISKILLVHLVWILFTAIFASYTTISIKFLLAKLWYIIPMYFLAILIIEKKDLKIIFKNLIFITSLLILFVFVKHSATMFDFSTINGAVQPFFRNHVTYASLLTILIPFIWLMFFWYKSKIEKVIIFTTLMLFIAGVFFSYTRAAYISVFAMFISYFIIEFKLIKPVLIISSIFVVILFGLLLREDKYLNYSPNFEKTITYDDFDDIVNATYKGTDLSTVERGYRWVAGYQMIKEKPILGFGPGNFYFTYRPYTVTSFQTYVSDNPEKSGIHSYYIMTLVEQGFIGFIIFILLVFYSLIHGEYLYHKTQDPELKKIIMAVLLSFIGIYLILLINDMIESIKVGSIFFFNLALLILIGKWEKETIVDKT